MELALKTSIWQQFGAALDTLDDAIRACPDPLWSAVLWQRSADARYGQFWFVSYHTLFWLDLFFTGSSEGFLPPPPFIRVSSPKTRTPKRMFSPISSSVARNARQPLTR